MSNIKRTITFLLAVITCMTFCCINSGAVFYNFSGPTDKIFFDEDHETAFAEVHITNWADEENDTDLYARTVAYSSDYVSIVRLVEVESYAELTVSLDDNYTVRDDSDYEYYTNSWEVIEAKAIGYECLNHEDHYGIIGFTSYHSITVIVQEYDDIFDTWHDNSYQPFSDIYIGTSS